MYGMVNQAISGLIVEQHGEAVWQAVAERAGIGHTDFRELDNYDDEVTHALVASASELLGASAEDLLFEFGKYWVLYTGSHLWSYLFDLAGNDFLTFLDGLDDLHDRVQTMMPESRMPQFTTVAADDHVVLEYRSDRDGLAPMVMGLLVGLQDRFGESWDIEQTGHAAVDGFDSFTMRRMHVASGERSHGARAA